MLHAQQQKLTVLGVTGVVQIMLDQLKSVTRLHGPAIALAVEGLAHQLERFDTVAYDGFAIFVAAMGVLAREIINLEPVHIALLIQALHGHR